MYQQRPVRATMKAKFTLFLGFCMIAMMPIAALGSRFGFWNFRDAFQAIQWDIYGSIATLFFAVAVGIIALIKKNKRDALPILLGAILAATALGGIYYHYQTMSDVPAIHDITTDWQNPPQFIAAIADRPSDSNSLIYPGKDVAQQQLAAYPDVKPIISQQSPEQAYAEALTIVQQNGWSILAEDPSQGIIEAVVTSFWFGFKDDITIRIQALDNNSGSKIDLRSVSRVGRSDLGANAKRIEQFITQYKQQEP